MGARSYVKLWIKPDTFWHTEVGEWIAIIERGTEKFPFLFHVAKSDEGYGGPAQSFEEARKSIEVFLGRKGLSLPKRQNPIPWFEP